MRLFRQYQFFLLFVALLVFCSLMVMRQFNVNRAKHVEIREAFILLHSRGYTNQANLLFRRLLTDLPEQSNKTLMDDFQRTLMLVDPTTDHHQNLIWLYHWTVSNELERRSEGAIRRARKLAEEY